MENFNYLLAAFIIIWVVLFVYIAVLSQRQRRVRREIDLLRTSLSRPPKRDDNG
jgi:CcmD family protein